MSRLGCRRRSRVWWVRQRGTSWEGGLGLGRSNREGPFRVPRRRGRFSTEGFLVEVEGAS